MVYTRRDVEELCNFLQQVDLGMSAYHDWLDEKRQRRTARMKTLRVKPECSFGG